MIPTNELRFVKRQYRDGQPPKMILQQKWIDQNTILLSMPPQDKTEWRDVPVVE